MCEATDSELSIRHLASALSAQENSKHKMLFLSPYQQHSKSLHRYRKNSSSESIAKSCKSSDEETSYNMDNANKNRDIILVDANINNNNKLISNIDNIRNTPSAGSATVVVMDGCGRAIPNYRKQEPKKYHSAISRIRNESVMRSKSFQEQGVKPLLRNSRFFVSRHHPNHISSDYSLDTVSQNIEITVQDEDGVVNVNDAQCTGCGAVGVGGWRRIGGGGRGYADTDPTVVPPASYSLYSSGSNDRVKSGHILGRIFRRMRKISLGWRKSRCKIRRGDWAFFFLNSHYILCIMNYYIL